MSFEPAPARWARARTHERRFGETNKDWICCRACGFGSAGRLRQFGGGHTYHDNGGVVAIEFKSGGKAFVSAGPVTQSCTYTENGKAIHLTCESDTTDFTLDDDGALSGPPNGMMARLTPLKK